MLREAKLKLPSTTDIEKADDLEKFMERALKSNENLVTQLEGKSATLPMHELLGLDKQLRSICSTLKVETAKTVQSEQHIKKERCKLEEICNIPDNMDVQ